MNTPICDFIENYAKKRHIRLHMPGHKGKGVLFGLEKYDITELSGADSLFQASGIIKQSEQGLTSLFDTASSLYSCEGSSLCVRAMLYLARLCSGEQRGYILAGRNAHSSLISAAALLDFDIEWLCPSRAGSYLSCEISAEALEKRLSMCEEKPFCVYITSPDYLGKIADIRALSCVCDKYGVLLVVDNAHGAYLRFLDEDKHPITQGAHMCCDSAHKTLPSLTGGAYLHISKKAPKLIIEHAKSALALFASSSPSYLILYSLDKLNRYLDGSYREELRGFIRSLDDLKRELLANGISIMEGEPLKLVINASKLGYTGAELASTLEAKGLMPEMYDPDVVVMMLTPQNTKSELKRLKRELLSIEKRAEIPAPVFDFKLPEVKCSIKEAIMAPKEAICVSDAIGRVCAEISTHCPPAVSLVVAGEEIDERAVELLCRYGFEKIIVKK